MKKLTKAQKANYPQFIVYLDFTGKYSAESGQKIFTKAMEEKNILDAMRRVEQVIQERGEDIYLAEIMEKTDRETEYGEPLYKAVIMTRVHMEYGKANSSQWHFQDEAHGEYEGGYYMWYGHEDRTGCIQFHSK